MKELLGFITKESERIKRLMIAQMISQWHPFPVDYYLDSTSVHQLASASAREQLDLHLEIQRHLQALYNNYRTRTENASI